MSDQGEVLKPYKHRNAYSLAIVALFLCALSAAGYHGSASRIVADGRSEYVVNSPDDAYRLWQEKKVKGRTLLLFDSYPHMRGRSSYNGDPVLTAANVVEYAVFQNVVRKVYLMVPENDWEAFRLQQKVRPIREVPGLERGLFLYSMSGIPLIATTPSSLPQIPEAVLVLINGSVYEQSEAMAVIEEKKIDSDIIILSRGNGR